MERVFRGAVLLAILGAGAGAARAEETVELIATAKGGADGPLALDRARLPSGEGFTLRMAVPGGDPVRATITTWPVTRGTQCDATAARGKQVHTIAMRVTGDGATRAVAATIPPLQIGVKQCFSLALERGLPEDKGPALAGLVTAGLNARVAWLSGCSGDVGLFEEELRGHLRAVLPDALARLEPPVAGARASAPAVHYVDAAVDLIVRLLALDTACQEYARTLSASNGAARAIPLANARVAAARKAIRDLAANAATSRASTTPLGFVRDGTTYRAAALVDVMLLAREVIADNARIVRLRSPGLADGLSAINAATDDTGRKQARDAFAARLTPAPGDVYVYLPGPADFVALKALDRDGPPFQQFADAARQHLVMITEQLAQLRAQDPANAFLDRWIEAIRELADAEAAVTKARADNDRLAAAIPALESGGPIVATLQSALTSSAVRGLLREAITYDVTAATSKPTDDKASWWTPTAGALVGLPILVEGGAGVGSPWLTAYGGVTIYPRRIDRVIDLDDQIGPSQRVGLTVGALLTSPELRGADIAGPPRVPLIPYVGVGVRVTQFLRVDAGAVIFTAADRNPVIEHRDFGVALSVGASIDADVWAAIQGKLIH